MKKLFNKNESGRSMVEMLGVLAIIGVLSVGGIAGYKYAMEQISANRMLNFIQKFYLALEDGIQDPSSEMNVVCANYSGGQECKKGKYQQACQLFLGNENCKTFNSAFWGGYALPGVAKQLDRPNYALWGYRTHISNDSVYLQFSNVKSNVCEKVLSSLNVNVYPRLYAFSGYCNSGCERLTENLSDANAIKEICYSPTTLTNDGDFVFTLLFDAPELDLIDARDED